MSILGEKYKLISATNQKFHHSALILDLLTKFKFTTNKMFIYGSYASVQAKYYGDYDFITFITNKHITPTKAHNQFSRILKHVEDIPNYFFIKFIVQNGEKQIIEEDVNKLTLKFFKENFDIEKVSFCQLDILIWEDNKFIEASFTYEFEKKHRSVEEINKENEKSLIKSIKKLKDEKKYFKIFKRMYVYFDIKNNHEMQKQMLDILNGHVGLLNYNISILDALIEAYKLEHDKRDIEPKVKFELKELNIKDKKDAEKRLQEMKDDLNKESLKLLQKYILPFFTLDKSNDSNKKKT